MSRNFEIGSRNMDVAGHMALKRDILSYSTIATVSYRWDQFVGYLQKQTQVRRLEQVTREVVAAYSTRVRESHERGDLSRNTAVNYISAVNTVMKILRGDDLTRVRPRLDAGLPSSPFGPKLNRGARYNERACRDLTPLLSTLTKLQREFGLRFEESAKIDAAAALREILATGFLTIGLGTKAGKKRILKIRNEVRQLRAIEEAAALQNGGKSMIPETKDYKSFHSHAYYWAGVCGVRFHDARHAYAQETYLSLAGWPPPIALNLSRKEHISYILKTYGVTTADYRRTDREVRLLISRELGHERISVTRTYLG